MKKILKFLSTFFCFMLISVGANADNALVNTAGKQRMLSQKVAKAYIFKGMGIRTDVASQQVEQGIEELVKNSKVLRAQVKDETVKGLIGAVGIDIDNFSNLVSAPYTKENAKKIIDLSETILKLSHEITLKIVDIQGIKSAEVINLSGRQRMLSQRATKFYIGIMAGVLGEESKTDLESVITQFDDAHKLLKNEPKNNRRINKELKRVEGLWGMIRTYYRSGDKNMPVTVFTLSDSVTEKMDKINSLYLKIF